MEAAKITEDAHILDAGGGIVMPGMVNLHSHLGMVPFRGLGDDCKDRLRVFLLPMEQKAMDAELTYLSTRYAVAEMLLGGVTTVVDMYYFEEEAARAMDEMGIRGIAGETIISVGADQMEGGYRLSPALALEHGFGQGAVEVVSSFIGWQAIFLAINGKART